MYFPMKQFNENVQKCPETEECPEETAASPIFYEEQAIMKAVKENSVVIIIGSDKTTQVPQLLYESGYTRNNKMIGVTEPQKIAAITMAALMDVEMNLPRGIVVGPLRHEVNGKTQFKCMTDGMLLKDIKEDPDLTKYSAIILDEVQERSFFSDVLVGLLSHIVQRRKEKNDPLKVIIMSATKHLEDFMENPLLFKEEPPVLIEVASQLYDVQLMAFDQMPFSHIEEAYYEVCRIHSTLPAGSILVFLADEEEVKLLCKMLQYVYDFKDYHSENLNYHSEQERNSDSNNNPDPHSEQERINNLNNNPVPRNKCRKSKERKMQNGISYFPADELNLDVYPVELFDDVENIQGQVSDDENSFKKIYSEYDHCKNTLYTVPFLSDPSPEELEEVYQSPPPNFRLCVVTTNIAEMCMPIDDIKYVIDSGKVKRRVHNASEGISRFRTEWISKVSACIRASCAGSNEGGHCFRLYTHSVYKQFPDCPLPEIKKLPADEIILQMKDLGIADVINFPFPSPPDRNSLRVAERRLVCLKALEIKKMKKNNKINAISVITLSGSMMIHFPIHPRYAKILMLSHKLHCISYISAVVSAMTVRGVIPHPVPRGKYKIEVYDNLAKEILWKGIKNIGSKSGKSLEFGDAMVLLRAVALFEESKDKVKFCAKIGLNYNAMTEVCEIRQQLHRKMKDVCKDIYLPLELIIKPPNEEQIDEFRKILTAGFTDHVARLIPEEEAKVNNLENAYQCLVTKDPVFIHPNSVLFSKSPKYIIYQEIVQKSKCKLYLKGIVAIDPEWLPELAPSCMCQYSDPLEEPAPSYDSEKDEIFCSFKVKYGTWHWEISTVTDKMPESILKYKWFSFFLLDGQVYNFFKSYRSHLLLPSSSILKLCVTALPRTYFLESLCEEKISSRASLKQKWEKDPKYLLREYLEWLPHENHKEVECHWPPIS